MTKTPSGNRFSRAAQTLIGATEEKHEKQEYVTEEKVAVKEPVVKKTSENAERPVTVVETVQERYSKLVKEQKAKTKVRTSLFLPVDVKEELDEMVAAGEIKNVTHFINYLIEDYLQNRKNNMSQN